MAQRRSQIRTYVRTRYRGEPNGEPNRLGQTGRRPAVPLRSAALTSLSRWQCATSAARRSNIRLIVPNRFRGCQSADRPVRKRYRRAARGSSGCSRAACRPAGTLRVGSRLAGPLREATDSLPSRVSNAVPLRVAEQAHHNRVYVVTPVLPTPYPVVFLIDLGYPRLAVPCGLCQKATAGSLQARQDRLLR